MPPGTFACKLMTVTEAFTSIYPEATEEVNPGERGHRNIGGYVLARTVGITTLGVDGAAAVRLPSSQAHAEKSSRRSHQGTGSLAALETARPEECRHVPCVQNMHNPMQRKNDNVMI